MSNASRYDAVAHELVRRSATAHPDATALASRRASMTYGELDRRSDRLAAYLASRGVGRGNVCAIALPATFDQVVAVLGVLKAGAAYVALDPSYPTERLRVMVGETKARVLITHAAVQSQLPALSNPLALDAMWAEVDAAGPPPRPELTPDDLAYVVFTSGTTGRPKGIMVPHRGIGNLAAAQARDFGIAETSRVLRFASFSFDASVSEIFATLYAGATLYVPEPEERMPGPALAELLRDAAITVVTLPPSALAITPADGLEGLQSVITAGEACPPEIVATWSPGRRFINAYGPSEVTVCATEGECEADGNPPCIGRPIANTRVVLLDDQLDPIPPGEIGELAVGGVGLAHGYLGQPALTAERFVPDPGAKDGARLYRTGDRGRFRPDGTLEFLGRIDHQVKLRGYRIEPGEIEAVLERHPSVRDALVVLRRNEVGEPALAAYVLISGNAPAAGQRELREHARHHLPEYMVPAAVAALERWPTTPAGKVDRAALPAPSGDEGDSVAPRDELEHAIAGMWEGLLGRSVGVHDSFFDVGGHSLLAIRLRSRIAAELGHELPVGALFEAPTVASLARLLRRGDKRGHASPLIALRRGAGLTPLFFAAPVSGSAVCYLPLARRLRGDRPFFGLQAPGLDGSASPITGLEELAAHYVAEVRRVQPRGPFLLGGWSLGGCIAFEMALQLLAAGDDVAFLGLIDANSPSEHITGAAHGLLGDFNDATALALYVKNFGRCLGIDANVRAEDFGDFDREEAANLAIDRLRGLGAPDLGREELRAYIEVFRTTLRAFLRYRPSRTYPGRLTSLVAEQGHVIFGHEGPDWRPFVSGPIDQCTVPGNHFTVTAEVNADELAGAVQTTLDAAARDID